MKKQNRREFLKTTGAIAAAATLPLCLTNCQKGKSSMAPIVLSKEVFIPAPQKGTAVMAGSFYTTNNDHTLMSVHNLVSRSDTVDIAYFRHSEDNGRTWGETIEWPTKFDSPNGTGRRHHRGWWVDANTGRCLMIWTEGVLPNDEPLEGMENWTLRYSVSEDGGKTWLFNEQIIHEGPEYDAIHHFPDITVGKNCLMLGDLGERPLLRSDGVIMLPVQTSPTGPDGKYYNPGGGYTWSDTMILFGRWQSDGRLSWTSSERVKGDPTRTTRGMVEPTIAELEDGTILMVMRGSNDASPEWPGYRWVAKSTDGGETWTTPTPWTYTSGENFYSPSSCSELLKHSDGRLFWIGNLLPNNPRGNRPRYPLVIGEVDQKSGLLIKDTVTVIDTRQPDQSELMTLSNFYMREDRQTGDLILNVSPMFINSTPENQDWTADAMIYRIKVA